MQLAAPAAERGEQHPQTDIDAPAPRAGIASFALLLGTAGPRDRPGPVGIWRADAQFHVYVPERAEPHVLTWRAQPGRRAVFADPVALADLHAGTAWRATLLPLPGMADRPAPVSGLAVIAARSVGMACGRPARPANLLGNQRQARRPGSPRTGCTRRARHVGRKLRALPSLSARSAAGDTEHFTVPARLPVDRFRILSLEALTQCLRTKP
jgi:hypothetical protein